MKALCVDDELIPLRALKKAVEENEHISEVNAFDDEEEALEWAESHEVDAAFLDIELHAMNGLELARELIRIHPQISIVFCTSHEQYAVRALKMHIDAGYLIKPFRTSQVNEEIEHILSKRSHDRKLKVKCFGDFDVFVDGKSLNFRRKRTKELLAYLIDRRGASVSTAKLCAVLWEDEGRDAKKYDILYHLVSDLRYTLKECGMEDVLSAQSGSYSINTELIDCDFYRMLDGDIQSRGQYAGEYMSQYSWAEYTNSWLFGEIKITK